MRPPKPGEVLRYAYLWENEARAGRIEGVKDRPCAVVLSVAHSDKETQIVVAPITHAPPGAADEAVEIPSATKERLGLDDERSFIVTTEVNVFTWPGYDIRPFEGGRIAYGALPESITRKAIDMILARIRNRSLRQTGRD